MFPASVPWSWRVSDSFTLAARSWDLRNSASLRLTHLTPTHSHFLGKVRWDDSYTQSNGWAFCVVHLFRQGPAGSDAALFLRSVLMNVGDLRKQIWCLAQIAACIARPPTNILFGALRIWFYYVSSHFIWGRNPQFICIKMLARLGTFQRMWSSLLNARVMLEALVSRSQVKSFNNPLREKALVPALIASTRWSKENIKYKVYK